MSRRTGHQTPSMGVLFVLGWWIDATRAGCGRQGAAGRECWAGSSAQKPRTAALWAAAYCSRRRLGKPAASFTPEGSPSEEIHDSTCNPRWPIKVRRPWHRSSSQSRTPFRRWFGEHPSATRLETNKPPVRNCKKQGLSGWTPYMPCMQKMGVSPMVANAHTNLSRQRVVEPDSRDRPISSCGSFLQILKQKHLQS